jgi:YD repeat-containing protein
VDYTEPDIEYTLVGTAGGNDPDTGDIYRGLDRFGRVKDCYWYNYGTSTDVDRIKYGYDRNGSRIWRENVVARSYGKYLDEKYVYDLIDRLKTMDRGALDSGHSTLDNLQFAQRWGLDATGNWRSSLEDSDGDASWNLDQTRTSNKVNEIADITESTGPSWATPAYNPAGNMTTIPKPADPTQSFTATYDAWKRLVKLEDTSGTVAQYEYDGAKRRTVKKTYVSGQLDETRHFFYTEPVRWQVIEERVGTSSNRDRHFVWGLRYIDDLILRDRDTNDDGTLDERLCGMQDANWNVTSIANHAAAIQERYAYHGYGSETAVTAAFAPRGSSIFDWETAFAGYRWDGVVMFFHVRNRLYAASIGNWLQRDPLLEFAVALPFRAADPRAVFDGFARIEEAILSTSSPLEGNNPYVYVSNNSLNRVDPLGLCVCRIPAAGLPPLLAAPPPMPGAFPGQRLMAVARGGQCWAGPPPSLRPWRLCLHPLNEIYCRAVPPACSIFMLWTWSWVWGLPPWGVLGWVGVTWDSCPPNPL